MAHALEAQEYMPQSSFDFGLHSRDFGYWPSNLQEEQDWFRSVLEFSLEFAVIDGPVSGHISRAVAEKFVGLWIRVKIYDELELVSKKILATGFWPEGCLAIRRILRWNCKSNPVEARPRLAALEELLRPVRLAEEVRFIVLSEWISDDDIEGFIENGAELRESGLPLVELAAKRLGEKLAADQGALTELLPELLCRSWEPNIWSLGRGIGELAQNPKLIWDAMVQQLAITKDRQINPQVLHGFLDTLRCRDLKLIMRNTPKGCKRGNCGKAKISTIQYYCSRRLCQIPDNVAPQYGFASIPCGPIE